MMTMDANHLREKLQNLETLMNKILEKEVSHDRDCCLFTDLGSCHDHKNDGINFKTSSCHDNGCHENCDLSSSPNCSSWGTTMCSLAKELETICSLGSSPRDSPIISPCVTPTNAIAVPPSSKRTFISGSGRISHQGSLSDAFNDPWPTHPPVNSLPSGARTVRVRHEETEDRLDRSLTIICRHNSPQDQQPLKRRRGEGIEAPGPSGDDVDKTAKQGKDKLKYRESAKYGLRFRLDLNGRDPDETTVSMDTEDHILRIYSGGEMIHLLQLAENTDPRTLSCAILDDGKTLFIKQKSKETMCLENEDHPSSSSSSSSSSSEVHLPVVRDDETTLTTTITLRLPPCLHGNDDVVVKTIDDTLMIRVAAARALHPETEDRDGVDSPRSGNETRFCVVMNLPEGTISRSVYAWVMKGQLTVKGQLIPTSRRMTCVF